MRYKIVAECVVVTEIMLGDCENEEQAKKEAEAHVHFLRQRRLQNISTYRVEKM